MAMSLTGAKQVPEIAFEYWGWVDTMINNPGMYGLDMRRSECHDRLCSQYKIEKETSRKVTDHLDKYSDVVEMHYALIALQKKE
jgi:hypothetical protein